MKSSQQIVLFEKVASIAMLIDLGLIYYMLKWGQLSLGGVEALGLLIIVLIPFVAITAAVSLPVSLAGLIMARRIQDPMDKRRTFWISFATCLLAAAVNAITIYALFIAK
jgi:hypothetical protein